jgi:oxalate decarboxylase/phosphoglucose isomerase-like protein (cupin superfamily)
MIRSQSTAYKAFAITPGATALERPPTHGILVCAAGNLTMTVESPSGDISVAFTSVAAGTRIELVPKKITAATATVVGLY